MMMICLSKKNIEKGLTKPLFYGILITEIKKGIDTMNPCELTNCGYYYQEEGEEYPRCHYSDDRFPAPCEEETYEEPYDECGFDPYEGCYTYDC